MRLRLNNQAVLCVEIMLDIASWVTQQIFAISMPAICHNRRTTTFYNFSTTFEAKRTAQEDTRRMKKISRIEYCAGFEPLQSGMEQDEGSRILLPTMKPLDWFETLKTLIYQEIQRFWVAMFAVWLQFDNKWKPVKGAEISKNRVRDFKITHAVFWLCCCRTIKKVTDRRITAAAAYCRSVDWPSFWRRRWQGRDS